ncbi:MAG: YfiM family protein [Ignavibacteria bacterium]|nr:YfiM family protein [Ignavibacteria bacterium]
MTRIFFLLFFIFNYKLISFSQSADSLYTKQIEVDSNLIIKSFPNDKISIIKDERKIDYLKLGVISGVTLGTGIGLHIYQSNAWWKDGRGSFHFQDDWKYALWIDKLGHAWSGAIVQHLFSSGFEWCNFDLETSAWLGSGLASIYMLYIEFEDGFGKDWGFSPGDAIFDVAGAFYPLAQYYIPFLKNFNLKYSYYPSEAFRSGVTEGKNLKTIIDDYEGQSFYLSFKMNELLPKSLEKYWPDFLCLAIGYNIRNWNGYGEADKNFYLALDYDLEQIPLYGSFWQFLKNSLNFFHLPAPGIKLTNNKIYFTIAY